MIPALLASQNPHKLEELRAALPGFRLDPLAASDYPEETGASYRENALLKARFGRSRSGGEVWVLGEDSGIECVALGGGPGLRSARFAAGRDAAEALLERLTGERERACRMVATLVALAPDGGQHWGEGVLEGELAPARRGSEGFGYDPVFIPAGEKRTVAELGEQWKRRHSHRALAARALSRALADAARPTSG